jgi:hypothetical protein
MGSFRQGYLKAYLGMNIDKSEKIEAAIEASFAKDSTIFLFYSLLNPLLILNFLVYSAEARWKNKWLQGLVLGYEMLIGNLPKLTQMALNFSFSQFQKKTLGGMLKGVLGLLGALSTIFLTGASILLGIGFAPVVSAVSGVLGSVSLSSLSLSLSPLALKAIAVPVILAITNATSMILMSAALKIKKTFFSRSSMQKAHSDSSVQETPVSRAPSNTLRIQSPERGEQELSDASDVVQLADSRNLDVLTPPASPASGDSVARRLSITAAVWLRAGEAGAPKSPRSMSERSGSESSGSDDESDFSAYGDGAPSGY